MMKLLTNNGVPLPVFHGTSRKFRKFKLIPSYRNIDGDIEQVAPRAFFFTDSKSVAQEFAYNRKMCDKSFDYIERPMRILKRYLQYTKALDFRVNDSDLRTYPNYSNMMGVSPSALEEIGQYYPYDIVDWNGVQQMLDDTDVIEALQMAGYDLIILRENDSSVSYAVLDAKQILTRTEGI